MTRALYPGSFDPFTMGHLDILKRACTLFDGITIGVLANMNKQGAFTPEERREMIVDVLVQEKLEHVEVCLFSGLTTELAKEKECACILRGIRDMTDFSYETKLEAINARLEPTLQTVYMAASPSYTYISSSAIKELCAYGASIEGLVPAPIQIRIAERLIKR